MSLDLQYHARLGLNHLTRNVDPERGYEPYFTTFLLTDPPEARHANWDFGDITGRFVDALILARQMTEDTRGQEVEEALRKLLLSTFSEGDGLSYRPDTPWSDHEADVFDQSSTLLALVSWYLLERDEKIKHYIDRMVEGLWRIAKKEDDYCYYEYVTYLPNGKEGSHKDNWEKADPCHHGGRLILPLARYFEETKDKNTRQLIEYLVNFIVYHSGVFGEDGSFQGHFHSRAATVAGILRFALNTDQQGLIDWSKKIYDWAKNQGLGIGWFPEFLGKDPAEQSITCETCIITDMIHVAMKLTQAGYTNYWEDVERYTRNHLIESQLRDVSWVVQTKQRQDTAISSFTNVPERAKGGFAGWSKPNDFIGEKRYPEYIRQRISHLEQRTMMNCCSPAGVRGLFLVWNNTIQKKNQTVYVNLSLNRDSEWVRVLSYLPYKGEVQIYMHEALSLNVRIPSWVDRDKVKVYLGNKECTPTWETNKEYIKVDSLQKDGKVTIIYPMRKTTEQTEASGQQYTLSWQGNTVVRISPGGQVYPLYVRDTIDIDKVPLKEANGIYKGKREVQW